MTHNGMCHNKSVSGTHKKTIKSIMVAVAAMMIFSAPVNGETLNQALIGAYINNPTLKAERANLRATDENVSQAVSNFRPSISASGDYGKTEVKNRPSTTGTDTRDPHGFAVSVSQPVFRGFRSVTATKEAKDNVRAGRQNLITAEQDVLLNAVTAYMDVVRDQNIVGLRRKNVQVLSEQERAAKARFRVGEVTKTDVAQATARHSGAISNLAQARANLSASRAVYQQIIGNKPGTLKTPKTISRKLPKTLSQTINVAREYHPRILAAVYIEKASDHAIDNATGSLLPEVSLDATYSYREEPSSTLDRTETGTVLGQVTIPLYQSGAEYSRIRQAKEINSQRRLQIVEAERLVRANAISAWSNLNAARSRITSDSEQVRANRLAYRGVKKENEVGSRTTLDLLDAEQELLDSRVALITTRRDVVVAEYTLLSAIGKLTAADLSLPVDYYDPRIHYDNVKYKWIGTGRHESD